MSDWGGLDGGEPSGAPQEDGWGSLDDGGTGSSSRSHQRADDDLSSHPEAAEPGQGGWGSLDGAPPPTRWAARDGTRPSDAFVPTPEATASLLQPNQTVWAMVDRTSAKLGSGQHIMLTEAAKDQLFGWRQVRIIDPGRLLGELVPIQWAPLARHTADEPSTLYRPPAVPQQASPPRAPAFPVGAGPDLETLFDRRVQAAKADYARMARESADRADKRIADFENQLKAQIDAERQRATGAITRAESVQAAAGREIAWYQQELAAARAAATHSRTLLRVTAIGGGVAFLIILVVLAVAIPELR